MKQTISFTWSLAILISILAITTAETVVKIESIEDLVKYNFECREGDVEINMCDIRSVKSAAELPSYFPESYRNLPGNNFMYVASRNASSSGAFALTSPEFPGITSGTYVMFKVDYYTEQSMTMGYMIFWADSGIGFFGPASNSEWKQDYSKGVARASYDVNDVDFFLGNDKSSKFTVFRSLEFIINPDPQIVVSFSSLDEFANSGAVCPNCELASVPSPQELPSYFPEGFRNLPTTSGNESIMYIDFQNTDMPTIIMTDLANAPDLSCTGYVELNPEFYNERISSFGWGKTYNTWSPYGVSEPSTWSLDEDAFYHLDYYRMQGNTLVGFYTMNDNFSKMSVFRKLEARIYYYPNAIEDCDLVRETFSLENTRFASFISG